MTKPSPPEPGRTYHHAKTRTSEDIRKNITRVSDRRLHLADVYAWLLQLKWRWALLIFVLMYFFVNTIFACVFLLFGDAIHGAVPGSFIDAFFFSVQTFSTVGYGTMAPKGLTGNFLVVLETMIGILCVALATGLIFAKFSRPTARVQFSNCLLIQRRNGRLALVLRLANERGSNLIEASIRVSVLKSEYTTEGDHMRRLFDLPVLRRTNPLFALSWTVIHEIDEQSPLHGLLHQDYEEQDIRFIVSMTGLDGTFSQTVYANQFYWHEDIVWHARFVDIMETYPDGRLQIDMRHFHDYTKLPGTIEESTLPNIDNTEIDNTADDNALLVPPNDTEAMRPDA